MNTKIQALCDLAPLADYSLMDNLNKDPQATSDGSDHDPREVFSGHYVPVAPTAIENPQYVAHSHSFFKELGFSDSLAKSEDFMLLFSGDMSEVPKPLSKVGWATGYALSIYGTEYTQQCPFRTGNAYGDGRAISVLEAVIEGKRWEMQLKGGGRTPYCRGADGRAVLRSSVREFLAQEHMYALGISTSRSLTLYTSSTEKVQRPWYSENSYAKDPDMMVNEAVAITTRVAPSFLRVGQLELFARRVRKNAHPKAMEELEKIVLHLIDREYAEDIDKHLSLEEKVVLLAKAFASRLTSMIANWIRVGYCQGNFNSDNCGAGGITLDYGPFGFCELFDPKYQSWTGGGEHFAFLNQHKAGEQNFYMFYTAIKPLVTSEKHLLELNEIRNGFAKVMQDKMEKMWASKLGLDTFNPALFKELAMLMMHTSVDYSIFFRELSQIPEDMDSLSKSFYQDIGHDERLQNHWSRWLEQWHSLIATSDKIILSKQMKAVNPKYILREWFLVPAYNQAKIGDYTLLRELQLVMSEPYAEQSEEVEKKYYKLKPSRLFDMGGVSHVSCSS